MTNLILFDLDNTLLKGDSDYTWGQYLIELGVLNRDLYQSINEQFYADYKQGKLDIEKFLAFQLKPLSQYQYITLSTWREAFLETKIKPMMPQASFDLIQQHQGDELVVITATNRFVTERIAELFGISQLIATEPEMIEGEFTGGFIGIPCFQEGKVLRLQQWLKERGKTLSDYPETWFYSDSHNDLPLLKEVNHPVAVNPDPILRQYAMEYLWQIIEF